MGLRSTFRCCDQSCISPTGSCKLSLRCEATSDERSAGKPHATFCGSRGRATAPGHPVGDQQWSSLPRQFPVFPGQRLGGSEVFSCRNFSPTSVHFKNEINDAFPRKRHQKRHLEFCTAHLRSRGSGVRISPGAPFFLANTRFLRIDGARRMDGFTIVLLFVVGPVCGFTFDLCGGCAFLIGLDGCIRAVDGRLF